MFHLGYIPDFYVHDDVEFTAFADEQLPLQAALDPLALPPIADQGALGSCVANGVTSALEFLAGVAGTRVALSRLQLYWEARYRLSPDSVNADTGSQIRDAVAFANQGGVGSEALWPYDVSLFRQKAPPDCYAEGRRHPLVTMQACQTSRAARSALEARHPVVIGATWYQSFFSPVQGRLPAPAFGVAGGHAFLCCGYDDTKPFPEWSAVGGLRCANSCGGNWGDVGYFWLPYQYFDSSEVSDCWALVRADF